MDWRQHSLPFHSHGTRRIPAIPGSGHGAKKTIPAAVGREGLPSVLPDRIFFMAGLYFPHCSNCLITVTGVFLRGTGNGSMNCILPSIPAISEKQAPEEEGASVFPLFRRPCFTLLRSQKFRSLPACGSATGTPCPGGVPVPEPPDRRFPLFAQRPRVPFPPPSPAAWIPLPCGRPLWWVLQ